MNKYIARMKDSTGEFNYSLMAESLEDADKRFTKLAEHKNWLYIEIVDWY